MTDLTVIFLTINEHPQHWTQFHRDILLKATEGFPIISISKEPLDIGTNLIQKPPFSSLNIYLQLLRAAKLADTPYVAVAESDVLYPREHFTMYRPPLNAVAYNMSKWSLFTWKTPTYSLRRRMSNATMIAPTQYLIDAIEERYTGNNVRTDVVGEIGRHKHEDLVGVKRRNFREFWSTPPCIVLSHPNAIAYKEMHHPERKKLGQLQAYDIPFWGRADELVKNYR